MREMKDVIEPTLDQLAFDRKSPLAGKSPVSELNKANYRQASGHSGPMQNKRTKGLWPAGRETFVPRQNYFDE